MKRATDMKTTWHHKLPPPTEPEKFHDAVDAAINPQTYGEWTATQMIDGSINESVTAKALDILIGYDRDLRTQLNNGCGNQIMVTLEVVTRQACSKDANGNAIDSWSMSPNDVPSEGDVVLHQGEPRGGRALTGKIINQYRARGESEFVQHEYKVRNGCIRVPFLHALDMLYSRGFRLPTSGVQHMVVAPSRSDYTLAGEGGPKAKTRMISNWWFREVFDDGAESAAPADAEQKVNYRRK
jgi:hypothetical protein